MSLEKLSTLSPAELYDIAQGDYRYTLTRRVLSLYSTRDLWWEGICHGWAQAASNYPEPSQVIVMNPDGIRVPLGSSDVKALLAAHDAYNGRGMYARVGERCAVRGKVPGEASERDGHAPMPAPELAETPNCKDMNAGAFHVVISNMIGIQSKSFVADVDRFNDVWNQPVVSYESSVIEEVGVDHNHRLNGVERRVKVALKMVYGEELQFYTPEAVGRGEINFVSKLPVTRTPNQAFKFKNYEYILELDAGGRVIGGEWLTETRPDFIWFKARDDSFRNGTLPLAGLSKIYRPVRY